MNIQKEKYPNRNWIKGITTKTPAMIGALTLGAGILSAGSADATMIIEDYADDPIIISSDQYQDFDVDDSGSIDIYIRNKGDYYSYVSSYYKSAGYISRTDSYATMFNVGDDVDASDFSQAQSWAYFWKGSNGNWANTGTTGYFGFGFYDDENALHYGWMEVTHGSTIITRIGYNDEANAAAPITAGSAVPEPGTMSLLAMGALGMAGMARRRQRSES